MGGSCLIVINNKVGLSYTILRAQLLLSCIRVYKISHMQESVRQISKNLQGRVWSGKHFNSDSRLGPGPAFDLIAI